MKYYYDMHLHSALSPCGDGDMTPNNIVNMALSNELSIVAVSDHNTCGNLRAVKKIADNAGVVFVPAMELETAEEIHVLCLCSSVDDAERFEEEVVKPALPDVKNNEEIFGRQQILNENDEEIAVDDRYLINATTIPIDNIYDLVDNYNGIAIPAHIDKQTKSLISVLGMTDPSLKFKVFELSKNAPENFENTQFSLKDMDYKYIFNSDAHYLQDIFECHKNNYFEFESVPTAEKIIKMLKE